MKKILFAVKDMNVGGVEKSLLSLLNDIDKSNYTVDLLLLEKQGELLENIPNWVHVIVWEEYKEIKEELNNAPLYSIRKTLKNGDIKRTVNLLIGYLETKTWKDYSYYYKKVFKKQKKRKECYDVVISYTSLIGYLTWYVEEFIEADMYIGWIHFDVSKLNFDYKLIQKLHKKMKKIYVVSEEAKKSFVKKFPDLAEKCELKYNTINKKEILKLADKKVNTIKNEGQVTIVTVGRLTAEKGQDIIPEVAKMLKDNNISFKWYLVGDGSLSERIINESKELGVQDRVILLGTKLNPYPYLRQADLYVQTSVHEGYCITLAEAKVFGMPIISTEFAGAHEQLDNQSGCKVVKRTALELFNAIIESIKIKYLN